MVMTVKPLHEKLRQCFKTNYEHGRENIWYDMDIKGMWYISAATTSGTLILILFGAFSPKNPIKI